MSIRNEDVHQLATGSGEVRSATGERIGNIGQVYLDNESGEPNWVTVKTGLFGTQETFVPLAQAEVSGVDVTVPYDKDTIKDAPRLDVGGSLTPEEERRLYSYYFSAATVQPGATTDRDVDRPDDDVSARPGVKERIADAFGGDRDYDRDSGDRDYDDRGDASLGADRTDDQVETGTGGSRLRRYVVTEKVVPVSREEVPVEDDPDRR
jgi:hypothetical protein